MSNSLSISTITLRITELATQKGQSLQTISQFSSIDLEKIQAYDTAQIPTPLTEEVAAEIRKIAEVLSISPIEIINVNPKFKREAVRLKIRERANSLVQMTLKDLSQKSEVHLSLVEFYSKQPIYRQKIDEPQCQKTLNKICKVLGCKVEDLLEPLKSEELPVTKLCLEELAQEKGLSLIDLSLLTNLPYELIDLMNTQPIDNFSSIFVDENSDYIMKETFCTHFPNFPMCKK
ncbi:MAG: helix-turn-helix transcriptional regulator [Nostoc sp.]|uniref:helix-turn-helix domain-containing protein n=1 Tax=Nostoc sp. TaxID=1180 RepID=UPI002FF83B0F